MVRLHGSPQILKYFCSLIMRAKVECNKFGCETFGTLFVDEPESTKWFKLSSSDLPHIAVSHDVVVPIQNHHRETRPAGSVNGHIVYRVGFVGRDEVGVITRTAEGIWVYSQSNEEFLNS
jgi:hypothetical protein